MCVVGIYISRPTGVIDEADEAINLSGNQLHCQLAVPE